MEDLENALINLSRLEFSLFHTLFGISPSISTKFSECYQWIFQLTSSCRKSYNLTYKMFTVLHRFSYVEMFVALSPSCITEDAMHHVLSTASAIYVSSASFWTIQSMSHPNSIHVPLRQRQMTVKASGITGQSSLFSTVCSDWQRRNIKYPRYCPFVRGIHQWPMDSQQKGTLTWEIFPFDDCIMSPGDRVLRCSQSYWKQRKLFSFPCWQYTFDRAMCNFDFNK